MLWPGEPPFLLFWLSVVAFSIAIALWAWQRRPAPGVRTFAALTLSLVVWSTAQVLHFASASPAAKLFWYKAEFLGMVIMPMAWLAFVLRYTGQGKRLSKRGMALLAIEPALTMLLVWSNEAHRWVWSNVAFIRAAAGAELVSRPGPWFWVHSVYANALLCAGMLLFIQPLVRGSRLYRTQGMTLLLSVLLAWIGGNLHSVFPDLGPAPLAVALLLFDLAATCSLLHYRLFDLIPVARATVLEQMRDAVFVLDAQERIVDLNQAAQEIVGKPTPDRMGQGKAQAIPTYRDVIDNYLKIGELQQEVTTGAGENKQHYDLRITPLRNLQGDLAGHLLVMHNATERKQTEAALQKSEAEKRLILDHISELVAFQDPELRILWANRAAAASVGLTLEELVGRHCYEIWHQRDAPCPGCPVVKARDTGQPQEGKTTTPDGRVWLVRGYPVQDAEGQVTGIVEVTQNITEQERALEMLVQSEERYRHLFQRVPVGLYRATPEAQIMDANAALVQMLGYPDVETLLAVNAKDIFVNPEDYRREQILLQRNGFVHGFEMQLYRYDGRIIWVQDHAYAVRDAEGKILYYEGGLADITQRKQAELALQQRTAELAALQATVLDIAAPHNLPDLLHTIVERAVELLHAAGGGLYLCDPAQQEARCMVSFKTKRDYTGTVLKYGEGAAGLVAQTGKPLIIDDYRTWAGRAAVFEEDHPFTAVCSVPMIWQGQVIGVLHALEDIKLRQFTPHDVELLTLFANHAAIAIENARLYAEVQGELAERKRAEEQLQHRHAELASLYETALEITAQLDLQQLLPIIVERANHLLHGLGAGIYLYRPQSDDLEYVAVCGEDQPYLGHVLKRGEGMAGKELDSGLPMTVADYSQWPGQSPIFAALEPRAVLAVPIKWGTEMLGVIDLLRPAGSTFSDDDIRLLSLFANQAAIAIRNARVVAAETQQRRRAEALAQATIAPTSTLELEPLLENILSAAIHAIPSAEKGSILLVDEPNGELRMHALVGYSDPRIRETRFVREEGYSYQALRAGHPLIIADARMGDICYNGEIEEMRAIQSAIVAPMHYRERSIGVISLDNASRKDAFSADDLAILAAFAAQAAVAIENARLYEAAQRELSERRQAEAALLTSEQRFRALFESSREGILITDAQSRIVAANPAAAKILGYSSAEELAGVSALDLYPDPAQKNAWFAELMQKGYVEAMELRVRRKDGSEAVILGGGVLRRDAEGRILSTESMFTDITELKRAEEERKKLEEQLRQAQKMEALGLLAGGMAHEFNNLLTIIQGNAELALSSLTPSQTNYQELLTIYKTAERAATLTRQVLALSRRQILQRKELDLNALISNLVTVLQRLIGESIELHSELAPDLPTVFADSGTIEQVIMNLVLNARDAMPEGGKLTIQTAVVTLDEAFCRIHPDAQAGAHVCLKVSDTGIGMDETVRSRLFEPFFTTKEPGKGSGLGLSVVYGIVKQHEGFIEVDSAPGQGAKFSIYLPIYRSQEQVERKEISQKGLPRGTETILIVEDEQQVRELTQQILETLGYTVLVASNGAEALELFSVNPDSIDLVILDAVMPSLSGQQTYQAMSALRPNLPVLFITGYSAEIMQLPPAELATLPILQKPFSVTEIGRRVREVLDTRGVRSNK